jgi:hypothetical protein
MRFAKPDTAPQKIRSAVNDAERIVDGEWKILSRGDMISNWLAPAFRVRHSASPPNRDCRSCIGRSGGPFLAGPLHVTMQIIDDGKENNFSVLWRAWTRLGT